jgi:hypothetical protein
VVLFIDLVLIKPQVLGSFWFSYGQC